MASPVQEIPVHVGQRLRDSQGRLWVVRELMPIVRMADAAHWFVARMDFWSPSGNSGTVTMSSQEFATLVKESVPSPRRRPAG